MSRRDDRPTRKLQLDKRTLRKLDDAALGAVAGGSRGRGTINALSVPTADCEK